MTLNLIFTVIHKMTKEAEDFSTMVKLAAKNTASYVNLINILKMTNTEISSVLANLKIMQLELFDINQGAAFMNSS